MNVLAIDPGTTGAACLLAGDEIYFHDWSTLEETALFIGWAVNQFSPLRGLIELNPGLNYPGNRKYASMKYFLNIGQWEGLMAYSGIIYETIAPRSWQSKMLVPKNGSDTKSRAIKSARDLCPAVKKHIHLKKHHNRADALLMALYFKARTESMP